MNKRCWKNGIDRLAQHSVATNLQFVKNAVSAKCSKAKCNKTIKLPYMVGLQFVHLFERPDHFLGLAIMHKPAINMCVQVFV